MPTTLIRRYVVLVGTTTFRRWALYAVFSLFSRYSCRLHSYWLRTVCFILHVGILFVTVTVTYDVLTKTTTVTVSDCNITFITVYSAETITFGSFCKTMWNKISNVRHGNDTKCSFLRLYVNRKEHTRFEYEPEAQFYLPWRYFNNLLWIKRNRLVSDRSRERVLFFSPFHSRLKTYLSQILSP